MKEHVEGNEKYNEFFIKHCNKYYFSKTISIKMFLKVKIDQRYYRNSPG
jgi:hypothetical protein